SPESERIRGFSFGFESLGAAKEGGFGGSPARGRGFDFAPVLADESERDWATRAEEPLAGGTRCSRRERRSRASGLRNPRSLIAWTKSSAVKAVRRVVWDRGANHSPGAD